MKNTFKVIPGKVPVLVSAPHVFAHKRPNVEGIVKQGELMTDVIVSDIARTVDCFAIMTTQPTDYDPNYHRVYDNDYKFELKSLVREHKIKYVIDVHGLSDQHPYDLGIFFKRKFRKSMELGYKVADAVRAGKLKDASISLFNFSNNDQETISEFVCDTLKVPAVQIEIARYIREDEVLMAQFVSNLSKLVLSINT